MSKQRGFSSLLILIIVAVIIGIGFYISKMKDPEKEYPWESYIETEKEVSFEGMEEPEGTPEEIGNEALEELDALMDEVDETVSGEDLSDL